MENTSSYNLFLDDFRIPKDAFNYLKDTDYIKKEWDIVRNCDEFCTKIQTEWANNKTLPSLISFDHDLADEHYEIGSKDNFQSFDYSQTTEKTGMDCAKWLVDFCMDNTLPLPDFKVHSMNTVGKENIIGLLTQFKDFLSLKG